MAAQLLITPARASDGDNAVYPGGKWYFYATGTTTLQTVYADAAHTTPLANPVISDSGGKFPAIYFDSSKVYRGVLRDLDDAVTIYDFDPINDDILRSLSDTGGAGFVGFSFENTYNDGTSGKALLGIRNVMAAPYNAAADNVANDSAAIQSAAGDGVLFTPDRLIKMDTAVTGNYRAVCFGTQFTGDNALDGQYPAFGPGALKVIARGTYENSIIGIVHNTAPADTLAFPAGVTGYGRNDNGGNHVFGIYAEARQHATTGVACNEIDSFNHAAAPSTNLPPNLGIGTTQNHAIGLQVGAGGTFNSSIGIHICREGSSPQRFLTGLYLNPDSCVTYGLFLDSLSTSTHVPLVLKHSTGQIGLQIQGVGSPVGGGPALIIYDGDSVERFAFLQSGVLRMSGAITSSTVGAAGGASALPANPSGYMLMNIAGTDVKVPYYAP